ncbi:MAG: AbrB/MazE/SpoVT family DNA-binding domain-containing protein [Bacillota bacterium]
MMEIDIIKIGNSKGIRFPLAVLKQCGIDSKVELEIKDNCIVIKPVRAPRQGWAEAFEKMHKNGDDSLLIPEELDNETLEDWDESQH